MSQEKSYLEFRHTGDSESGKTRLFAVLNKENGSFLGGIKWHAAWRKYCFFPAKETIFDMKCLKEIMLYLDELMKERV